MDKKGLSVKAYPSAEEMTVESLIVIQFVMELHLQLLLDSSCYRFGHYEEFLNAAAEHKQLKLEKITEIHFFLYLRRTS